METEQNAESVAYLTMPEEEAVEVYGAIEAAVRLYEAAGNTGLAEHYHKLLRRLQASDGSPMSVDKLNAMSEAEGWR